MAKEFQTLLRDRVERYFRCLQDEITAALEHLDGGANFREEIWSRDGGGGGRTRVLEEGNIFEKAGVNFSAVHGDSPMSIQGASMPLQFFATGVSLVLHPRSPHIPTVHANWRYFEQSDGSSWFGGGTDLTPYYLDEADARAFHAILKHACDKHDPDYYKRFKQWCDEYFFIKHRGESRGIGGLFFDNLTGSASELERIFAFVQDCSAAFLPAYLPIAERHRDETWSEVERHWQLLRRGRYVEFNLVYDRGTKFGLETGGRIESILMSLPTVARWEYDVQPPAGSREAELIEVLRHPRNWVSE